MLDDLLPLLRTIQPAKLNATLNALATALEGRGERLGENLELVDGYFTRLNPELPTIKEDISGLADVSQIYADAAPDLVRMLRNFSVTTSTIRAKSDALRRASSPAPPASRRRPAGCSRRTSDRIIELAAVGRPTLDAARASTRPSTPACSRAWRSPTTSSATPSPTASCTSPSR